MDIAWLLGIVVFFFGCDLSIRLFVHLRPED